MATSEENDLIGYDPLAWMDGDVDKVEETIDKVYLDSNKPEDAGCDNDVTMTDDYSDDLIENAEEIVILNITKENELVIDEIDSDSVFIEERGDDSMDGEGNWAKVDALGGSGAVAEDSVSEEMDGAQIDLDSTLTIQNVVKLHEKLKNLLGAHDEIEINASDVSSIDTATLQLLVSLKKDEVKLQKKATIIYPSPRFVESAKLLGLLDILGVHDE